MIIKNIILYGLSKIILFINNNVVIKLSNKLLNYRMIFIVSKCIDIRFIDKISLIINRKNKINSILNTLHEKRELQDRDIKILVCFRYISNQYSLIDNIFHSIGGIIEPKVYWRYINIADKTLSKKLK